MNESIYDTMTSCEKEVANVLKEMGIKWKYEHPVFVWDENKRPRVWAPDFYLINLGIYIEVCGSEQFDYQYRKKIFDYNGHKVIFLHLYKEHYMWRKHLISFIRYFIKYNNKKLSALLI